MNSQERRWHETQRTEIERRLNWCEPRYRALGDIVDPPQNVEAELQELEEEIGMLRHRLRVITEGCGWDDWRSDVSYGREL